MPDGSPLPVYEEPWWREGKYVAGVDEVGRGALAGPVVAAAIILPIGFVAALPVRDSKTLSPRRRERVAAYLRQHAIAYAFGRVEATVIDTLNIAQATLVAMAQALAALNPRPDFVFVDGISFPPVEIPGQTVVQGDQKCLSIAAASILAKVDRDTWMREIAESCYPDYGFARHKGYATFHHRQALHRYGPCILHRRTFLHRIGRLSRMS
ncbi:MAG: ribonuclease HII [Candidatus Kapabacteria bacterium]|nr:ribonuclease HII [Candidatus Kapabacteria bacterium]MDW8225127.1 ribonuclease HII [Bacteroidota bacterium]